MSSPPFRKDSYRTPSGVRAPRTPGMGMGSRGGGAGGGADHESDERFQAAVAWAKEALPGEHPPFAAVAAQSVRRRGHKPTAENVLTRLRAKGWDMATLERLP